MFDTNPNLIQDGGCRRKAAQEAATPLVLFHDGGGTIYSYYMLGSLDRPVYGIANPRFETGVPWVGGLCEMAAVYAGVVAEAVPSGPVFLGGWSLGGLLALETACVLAERFTNTYVAGFVLIDSVCPFPPPGGWGGAEQRVVERRIEWQPTTKPQTKRAVERCFREAYRMVHEWKLPTLWPIAVRRPTNDTEDKGGTVRDITTRAPDLKSPPVVLLRSQERFPVSGQGEGVLFVDLYRDNHTLGWDNYCTDMFSRIIDIPGHHYNVFALTHLEDVTNAIRLACQTIEEYATRLPCSQ